MNPAERLSRLEAEEAAGATGGDGAALDPLSAPAAHFVAEEDASHGVARRPSSAAPFVETAAAASHRGPTGTGPVRPAAASTFPTSDAFLARTIVYDDPRTNSTIQTLVSLYSNGAVEVAQRPTPGASWGPPWTLREDEGW